MTILLSAFVATVHKKLSCCRNVHSVTSKLHLAVPADDDDLQCVIKKLYIRVIGKPLKTQILLWVK